MKKLLRKMKPYIGMVFIYTGTLLLVLCSFFRWTSSNVPLFLSVFLILAGVCAHVAAMKSSYDER